MPRVNINRGSPTRLRNRIAPKKTCCPIILLSIISLAYIGLLAAIIEIFYKENRQSLMTWYTGSIVSLLWIIVHATLDLSAQYLEDMNGRRNCARKLCKQFIRKITRFLFILTPVMYIVFIVFTACTFVDYFQSDNSK